MDIKESTSQFIRNAKRVFRVSRKPDKEEFLNFSKVTAIGIAIIGVIGFVIILIGELIGI
jgi:protein transport protein SEC61 subunit gamma-like protein